MNDATMLFLCRRFDGHGWSPKSQKMWKNNWNGTWDKGKIHKTLRFFPFFFVWEQIFNFYLTCHVFKPRSLLVWTASGQAAASVNADSIFGALRFVRGFQRPRGGRSFSRKRPGFLPLPETRRGQAVNVGFGSIMIEQDLMEARHGKEQWKGTHFMTGQEMKFQRESLRIVSSHRSFVCF